jgi:glycosyltransferase involved in cell wall biosynthesis
MALRVPVVASPVGENARIVRDGRTGYLACEDQEWVYCWISLIEDPARRTAYGNAGQRLVVENYSMQRARKSLNALLDDLEAR